MASPIRPVPPSVPLVLQRGVLTQEQVERLRRHIQQEFEAERESQLEGAMGKKQRKKGLQLRFPRNGYISGSKHDKPM